MPISMSLLLMFAAVLSMLLLMMRPIRAALLRVPAPVTIGGRTKR